MVYLLVNMMVRLMSCTRKTYLSSLEDLALSVCVIYTGDNIESETLTKIDLGTVTGSCRPCTVVQTQLECR